MRRPLVLVLSTVVSGVAAAAPPLAEAPEARDPHPSDAALVVGIDDYFMLPDAPGAKSDANVVRETLVRTRGVPEDRVTVLTDGANRERILSAARSTGASAGTGGTAWLFFAGHAVLDAQGELHLLGADAQQAPEALLPRGVTLSELAKALRSGGGRPVLWLDAGSGPDGRSDRPLTEEARPKADVELASPTGAIVWTAAPGATSHVVDGHGAFTYLSVGALRGWADGHGGAPEDGTITPEEAQAWAAASAVELDVAVPVLKGDTTALAWATGVGANPPKLSANDVRSPATDGNGNDGPVDVAAEAETILSDARGSLRRMAVGLGGDAATEQEEVTVGRAHGRSEEDALAPALAEHLDRILPTSVQEVRFAAFTSRPPLSARVVTVNFDIRRADDVDTFLVEGITLPSSPNWPQTAEQIGRKLVEQLAIEDAEE